MQTITTIGLDIANSVFQVHGVDAEGNVILQRFSSGKPITYSSPTSSCRRRSSSAA
jgi:transposase